MLDFESAELGDSGAVIQDVRNGSVIVSFLVQVGAQLAAELLRKLGEYVWKRIAEKRKNKKEDNKISDMVDPEANRINVKK